jgi:hypothetical protein
MVTPAPDLRGTRRALVLAEDRVGHYAEFRDFFVRAFDLGRVGLADPGYVRAPSGLHYALVFAGRSGEPFPAGVEIHALVPALEPLDEPAVDRDLWAILRWMIAGVGAPWTVQDLEATGRLYRTPAVSP